MKIGGKRLSTGLLLCAACYCYSGIAFAGLLRSRIYQPDPMPEKISWEGLPPPEMVEVRTGDGLLVKGYRWRAKTDRHIALVFFHGNSGNRLTAAKLVAPLLRPDADIIVASYRGYGGNPGTPSESGLYEDGRAFVELARKGGPAKIYLAGYSMGGAIALRMAATHEVDGVVALSTFATLDRVVPAVVRPFLNDHFDNERTIREVRAPVLLFHGTADEVVPFEQSRILKEAAGANARLLRLEGAPHHYSLQPLARLIWGQVMVMPAVHHP